MKCAIVIPARMGSTRFPGKPLCDLLGKPMIQWVFEAAVASNVGHQVIVATPDPEIAKVCAAFGAGAILTLDTHPSGTDRIAEVAQSVDADFFVNVQGDEPLIKPETIAACARPFADDSRIQMSSVFCYCTPDEEDNPAVVKVVTDIEGRALYFSRYPIPFARNQRTLPVKKHVGIYAYTKEVVQRFSAWPQGELEKSESLEQLRFMENGIAIQMVEGEATAMAVDTPDQAEEVRRVLANQLRR